MTQTARESILNVSSVQAGSTLVIPGGQTFTTSSGNFSINETRITAASASESVSISVSASAGPPANVSALDQSSLAQGSTDGVVSAIGYLTVTTDGLESADNSSGSIRFNVSQSVLDSLNVSADNVALFRYNEGQYQRLNTTHLGDNQFEASTPGFSTFAIGAVQSPDITVDSASLDRQKISPGDSLSVTATVVNSGSAAGSITLGLSVNGTTVATQNVTVAAEETATSTFTTTIEQPGVYEIAINNVSAGTVEVQTETTEVTDTPEETDVTDTPEETDVTETPEETTERRDTETDTRTTTTSTSGPGFGMVLALIALLALALLAVRRRD